MVEAKRTPFYMLLPMNIQPKLMESCNLLEFTEKSEESKVISTDMSVFNAALGYPLDSSRITVKVGGGAADVTAPPKHWRNF